VSDVAAGQCPRGDAVFLDHNGHFVPDMAAAATALQRLGFTLTPYALHTATTDPDRPSQPSGTANRCIMLGEGYLEILCAVGDTPLAQQLKAACARYTGLHLLAFSAADATVRQRRLTTAGFAMQPVVHLTRAVDDGVLEFSVVRPQPGQMPEGRVQFLSHGTPELLWRPALTAHPNRAAALCDVVLASADADEAAARFGRFLGADPAPRDGGWHIALARGGLTILSAGALKAALPGIAIPDLPFLAATALRSDDLAATRAHLAANGIACTAAGPGALRTAMLPELGSTFVFTEGDAPPPWLRA